MIDSERTITTSMRSGWCMSDQCHPTELTVGCKRDFSGWICACACHDESTSTDDITGIDAPTSED